MFGIPTAEGALIDLVRAVDSGVWYDIDLAMEIAKETLGFDPTKLVGEED